MARPRSFDTDEVLATALDLFWRKGYAGTSVSDITDAVGVNRPSLYAAFGSKEELFNLVLDRYTGGPACFDEALAQPSARAVAEEVLRAAVELNVGRGCLIVRSAVASEDESVHRAVVAARTRLDRQLRRRFTRAIAEGDLPDDEDPAALADFLCTAVSGISVQAAMDAGRAKLQRFADRAMLAWPS